MAMKCLNCGTENPEGKAFCGDCGATLPQPPPPPPVQPMQYAPAQYAPIQKKPGWLESNWKGLVGVVVVLVILAGGLGLVYSQPWSKIKVIITNSEYSSIGVNVYIDGVLKSSTGVSPGISIVGVWSVSAGTHTVQIDNGHWDVSPGYWYTVTHWFSPDETFWVPTTYNYVAEDGTADITYAYEVGPLYTKNVYFTLS